MLNQFQRYRLIFISSLFPFIGFWLMNLMNVLGQYLEPLNISQVDFGYLVSSYIYSDAIMLIPVGVLLNRFCVKHVLIIGLVIFSLGNLLFILSNGFYLMLAARIISGCGHAFALMCCFKLISNYIQERLRATFISISLTIAFCGGIMAQAPSVLIISYLGVHGLFWLLFLIGILICAVLSIIIPYQDIKKSQSDLNKQLMFKNLFNYNNILCSLFIFSLDIPIMILGAAYGISFLALRNINIMHASSITSFTYLGTIIGSILFGVLASRVKNRTTLILSCCLISASILFIMIFVQHLSFSSYVLVFGLSGMFSSIQGIGYAFVEKMSPNFTMVAMSVVNVLLMFESATLQAVFGQISEKFEINAFYILPILMLLGGFLGAWLNIKINKNYFECHI